MVIHCDGEHLYSDKIRSKAFSITQVVHRDIEITSIRSSFSLSVERLQCMIHKTNNATTTATTNWCVF